MSTQVLRQLLTGPDLILMPCCYDALSARLIEEAGFPLTFMSGFGVAASRLAMPDTGLISFGEMLDQGRSICQAVTIPVLGDGDTGYGNAMNVKRTVREYARAGFTGILIEDQESPKRCGHVAGKSVVDFDQACARIQAAVDARNEGADILILARTDARGALPEDQALEEALRRIRAFDTLGADILFLEAPRSVAEMRAFCAATAKPTLANMLEGGVTPLLPPAQLEEIGYKIVAYPLTLQLAWLHRATEVLHALREGRPPEPLAGFEALKTLVGFPAYNAEARCYSPSKKP